MEVEKKTVENAERVVFSRDRIGKTTIGNTVVQLPQTVSALSVIATNGTHIQDGDNFGKDYWIYDSTGKRKRKWFAKIPNSEKVFWPPKLDDITTLEAKRWKWYQRRLTLLTPEWQCICARLRELGNVGGYFDNGPKAKGWIQFDYSEHGIGWRWSKDDDKEKPEIINQEFVDWYFDYEKRSRTINKRYRLFKEVFLESVEHNFKKDISEKNTTFHLCINGRDYWFTRSRKIWRPFFEVLAFPEDISVVRIER